MARRKQPHTFRGVGKLHIMRYRITFAKLGALRYTGNLDLHKLWERAVRRAELPLTYSQGFHPQPKISLAAALPLGFSSRAEVMDLRLNEEFSLDEIKDRLRANLPGGIQVLSVERVDERAPALQTQLLSAEYEITLTEAIEKSDLVRRMDEILRAKSLQRERRGKQYDLRPLIEELRVMESGSLLPNMQDQAPVVHIFMRLAARDGATGRPEEVLEILGISAETARVERTRLIFRN
jgi:radical SAM-linked protein